MLKKLKNKTKNKFIIGVNIFLIAVLMVVAVYAWFSSKANNTVDSYDIEVQADNALELSFDNTNWSGNLNLKDLKNADKTTNVLDTMKFVEVTGDGNSFNVPQLTQKANYALVNTNGQWTAATANKDYLSFDVYLRSKDPLDVYFGSESKAAPTSETFTGASSGNKSGYGDFSKDCIVGALRVAAFDNSNTKKFVWITNPEFHLNNAIASDTFSMTTNATASTNTDGSATFAEGSNYYWNNSFTHYYYASSSATSPTKMAAANVIAGSSNIPNSVTAVPAGTQTLLAQMTTKTGDYYTGHAKFNVWIEGCDTEARRALVNGTFSLKIVFDSFAHS